MGEKSFPVVLDNIFHGENAGNLTAIVKWLNEQPRQVLLFTDDKATV